jgi:hypothetical protein
MIIIYYYLSVELDFDVIPWAVADVVEVEVEVERNGVGLGAPSPTPPKTRKCESALCAVWHSREDNNIIIKPSTSHQK